ncbi:uncharacterized protein BDR25DRAFT_74290 [Lindgomyces ingoldianus]|uniref:Uncharacterized protein n=1 Tax=Lindgomyces ingoldianus TaxID=673940 RepID=A0ACB6QIL9_9PLEO|nr:uncharacterized protein BDR25DRAFT_74290 [Lindgomyces ingoldianus]KAF2466721.1 hypothetical protein BDR25DRAFT_74290 [Lindgomyces ingoldianus]
MASIFTFDPDPPRVSSPWSTPPPDARPNHAIPQDSATIPSRAVTAAAHRAFPNPVSVDEDYSGITRLEAEPQEGPTEYKLHLLLRRRRSFTRTSTGRHISGSLRRTEPPASSSVSRSVSEAGLLSNTPPPLSSTQARQHRLEQLTTQLLWRLQQSCPYHISSSTDLVLPHLAGEANLSAPAVPRQLLPGLEESKGALYEIGVADDGSFVGLAEDEMEESLNNLRAMAASLGCCVDILRMVAVGDCEWVEDLLQQSVKSGKLWVAEAFIRPDQNLIDQEDAKEGQKDSSISPPTPALSVPPSVAATNDFPRCTQQLRISLTGATMSGKSSLLGSLSTATLDNGRGKSRLSLLKHRHEIVSGMTSSVTQELIGYQDVNDQNGTRTSAQVVSYGAGNVSSWVDIHATAEGGRLVFISDSAGHPRFRRTTVRGLVGWDPHWTLLCIPADNTEDSSGRIGASTTSQEVLGPGAADVDLSQTHLQLCLNLGLPLLVIITKLDLANKPGLRQTLAKVLSALKDARRKPCFVSDTPGSVSEADLNVVSADDLLEAGRVVETLESDPLALVPIIFTSAVKGSGINKLHAFLRELPLPAIPEPLGDSPRTLFYIEDIYSNIPAPSKPLSLSASTSSDRSAVVGGHLCYGTLHVGHELLLGPYPVDTVSDDSDSGSGRRSTPPSHSHRNSPVPTSRSFPGALHKGQAGNSALRSRSYGQERNAEWRRVRITSLRNLRLPVRSLHAGQVGTIGVVPLDLPIASPTVVRIRKGMVLIDGAAKANRVIAVRFLGANAEAVKSLTVGSAVVAYVASVRASAKVVSVASETTSMNANTTAPETPEDDEDGSFGFGFDDDDTSLGTLADTAAAASTVVTFQFIASREFVEVGAKVLVLPGGGPGLFGGNERGEKGVAALEGFVGRVIEGY